MLESACVCFPKYVQFSLKYRCKMFAVSTKIYPEKEFCKGLRYEFKSEISLVQLLNICALPLSERVSGEEALQDPFYYLAYWLK
jgi:hypothetical protein